MTEAPAARTDDLFVPPRLNKKATKAVDQDPWVDVFLVEGLSNAPEERPAHQGVKVGFITVPEIWHHGVVGGRGWLIMV